jgi:hypothetical protein
MSFDFNIVKGRHRQIVDVNLIGSTGSFDSKIVDVNGHPITAQNPFHTNGDRVYTKDLDLTRSDNYNFGTSVEDLNKLFNGLHNEIEDVSGNLTKELLVHFNWSIISSGLSIECNTTGKNFSNLKVEILRGGGTSILIVDESADNTKYDSRFISFASSPIPIPPIIGFNAVKLTFTTTDDICLTDINISKVRDVNSYLITQDAITGELSYIKSTDGFLNVFSLDKEYQLYVNKWGQNDDIDTATTPETIWDGSDLYTYTDFTTGAVYAASSDIIADAGKN